LKIDHDFLTTLIVFNFLSEFHPIEIASDTWRELPGILTEKTNPGDSDSFGDL
jgi:hypothetical protein